ncbi:MAG: TonB-dependent receptor [Phormidesmis sp.]
MKVQQVFWLAGSFWMLWVQAAWAGSQREIGREVEQQLSGLAPMEASLDGWMAQAEVAEITAIRIMEAEGGTQLVIETASGMAIAPTTSTVGNALVVDIPNAVLGLADGEDFQVASPTEGIAYISAAALNEQTVRIAITGAESAPQVDISRTNDGLTISLTPVMAGAEDASEAASEANGEPSGALAGAAPLRLVVTATRTEEDPTDVPRSVTIIPREQIEQQATVGRSLNDILGQLVPGFGPSSDRAFTENTLRGRTAAVLIDGVPQNTNARSFDRELRNIDPSAIERIEVVRGSSAIYGGDSTGGLINIITRQPAEDEFVFRSEIGVGAALGSLEGDSFGTYLQQYISARQGIADFTLSTSLSNPGGAFDAEGDRIPIIQGTDGSGSFNILGKIGLALSDEQRLQLSVNHLQERRNTGIISDPSVDDNDEDEKARALDVGELEFPTGGGPQSDRNTVINLNYNNQDLWGSQLDALVYYRNNFSRSDPRDRRPRAFGIFQGELDATNWGTRIGVNTPLSDTVSLLWGADYDNEENSTNFNLFDPDDFDETDGRVNRKIEERPLVPNYALSSLGLFGQIQWDVTEDLQLSGGTRYENIGLSVGDYTTFFGDFIGGGDDTFEEILFNVGAVYDVTDEVSLFASFAQGFSVPDFTDALAFAEPGATLDTSVSVSQPQKVNEFELGVRGAWEPVQASLSAFYNQSDLGSTLAFSDDSGLFETVRAPERVYGIEATVDAQIDEFWALGGTISWSEGEADLEDDGNYTALSGARIQPLKLTAYVENETLPGWNNRFQALLVGSRDRAFDAEVDVSPVNSYFIVDFISSVEIGDGTLKIGIENLFDTQYFPAYSQRISGFSETFNSAGQGRIISLGYEYTW